MTKAKKILFLGGIGLTACSIMLSVKSIGHNSLIVNKPDNAGEMRSREARTAPIERHTSPALSGFFVRSAQKGRCIVESVETQNTVVTEKEQREIIEKVQNITDGVTELSAAMIAQDAQSRQILKSVEGLLDKPQILSEDFVRQLKVVRDIYAERVVPLGLGNKEEAEEQADSVYDESKYTVERIENILNMYGPDYQRQVLKILVDGQPMRDRQHEEQEREQAATNKLLDAVSGWSTESVELLNSLLVQANEPQNLKVLN